MLDLNGTVVPFLTFLTLILFSFSFFSSKSKSKTKTPSPESHPIIGNLLGFLRNRHRFHDWVAEQLSGSPSSTIQVNSFLNLSNGVATADPANVRHLLHTNFPNYVKGSRFSAVLRELLGDGIFNADGPTWTLQRKIASHEFSTKSLKNFITDVVESEITERLLPSLCIACDESLVIDLQKVLEDFTFNNMCNVAFGVDPSTMEENSYFIEAFNDATEICWKRFMSPVAAFWKAKRLLNIEPEKLFKEAIYVINEYAMDVIASKERSLKISSVDDDDKNHQDLLSRFIVASSDMEFKDGEQRRKFLRDIVISFILAGKDSTSTALTWFFWLIAGHPRCADAIRVELDSLIESPDNELLSGNEPRIFSYDELKKLHYLHAALSESVRLFPPVPIDSRLTVDDDVWPDGTRVRKGWFADYSAYAMGRMERVWGKDCREFRPERWLDDDRVFQPCDQFKFPVFHGGPRLCLGKDMAYLQMKLIAATVLHQFEIVAINGGATPEKMMNPPYKLSLLLKMRGGFPVQLKRRCQ
ncbi:hypothetical protein AB3S75_010466 [Citrus x aurantiifolia]